MPRRCVFGCPSKGTSLHRFPNAKKFPERLKAWVDLVGGKLESASDYEFYKKKMVCDRHFTDADRDRHHRLTCLAIPSLYLHGESNVVSGVEGDSLIEASTSAHLYPEILQPHTGGSANYTGESSRDSTSTLVLPCIIRHKIWRPADTVGTSTSPVTAVPLETASQWTSFIKSSEPTQVEQPAKNAEPIQSEHNYSAMNKSKAEKRNIEQHSIYAERIQSEHNYSAMSKCKAGRFNGASNVGYTSSIRPLQTKIRHMRSEIIRLRKRAHTFKQRLENAQKIYNSSSFRHLIENMTSPAQLFVNMQLQNKKKPKGRRFTLDEKILALSLYKKSPKCFKLLNKYFTLPSVKAMKRLLSQVKLSPGINEIIFKKIKETVKDQPVHDRLCSLIFDEMSLTPQVSYNPQKDSFEGFASNNNSFADHVLVFMVKGVKNNFKQPVAYYFTTKMNKIDLKKYIKDVVTACQTAGLKILNTVCDQSTVNVSAINELVQDSKSLFLRNGREWRHDVIRINRENIIPLYDTPHLIKGIRNNLLNKDMIYKIDGEEYLAKWEYYQKLYIADLKYEVDELRMVQKLTEEHVNPERINKMRVKLATQIFSHSVAIALEHLTNRGDLEIECKQLVKITLLLDNLFDSLNVNSFTPRNGKKYTGAIKKDSCHHELWKKSKLILKSIRFREIKKDGNKSRIIEKIVPSVTNFIKTIDGMEAIWHVLAKKYGFDSLLTRNLNQDPIENFFGNIRSYGARNNAPNTVAFQGAFKALLLNNYSSPHSSRANCEEDTNKCLQSLKFFLTEETETSYVPNNEEIICNNEVFDFMYVNEVDAGQINYVCGWVLKKCLKNIVKGCRKCKQDLLDNNNSNEQNSYIKAKEYSNKKWLCYPNKKTENCFKEIQKLAVTFLKNDVPNNNIKKNILAFANMLVEYPFDCPVHKENLEKYFANTTLNVILNSWCRSINRILSGKLKYDGDDKTKIAAQEYFNRHKHYKNKK